MKIGEIWVTKQNINNEFCKIQIFDKVSPELWIVEVLECSRLWQDWFYLFVPTLDSGDCADVRTMKFIMRRADIVEAFTKAH